MKARLKPKDLSHAEAVATTQKTLEYLSPAITAIVLNELYDRGWHKETLKSLFYDIRDFFRYPQQFGKWLTDIEIKNYLTEHHGIIWQDEYKISNVCCAPKRLDSANTDNVSQTAINCCFPAAIAAVLYVLQRRTTKWNTQKLQEIYMQIINSRYDTVHETESRIEKLLQISFNDIRAAVKVERR